MNRKIKVLIADDHEIVRTGLSSVVDIEDDMTCVGAVRNGLLAAQSIPRAKPDVVVMDLMMPEMNGIEATRKILAEHPGVHVLILTTFGSAADIRSALDAGADGALLKSTPNRDIIRAIRALAQGRQVVDDNIRSILREELPPPNLSDTQMEILVSVSRGLSNKDISKQLSISYSSVKRHLAVIFDKIGAATRAEAASIALSNNWLKRDK